MFCQTVKRHLNLYTKLVRKQEYTICVICVTESGKQWIGSIGVTATPPSTITCSATLRHTPSTRSQSRVCLYAQPPFQVLHSFICDLDGIFSMGWQLGRHSVVVVAKTGKASSQGLFSSFPHEEPFSAG